jgi:FKBP-type peptidyl-prolyl cis-trans isomerase FkpA
MNFKSYQPLLFVLVISLLLACAKGGLKTNPNGMKYQFHKETNGTKPKTGDILNLSMTYYTQGDSLLFNTAKINDTLFQVKLMEPSFKGAVEEGFAMMSTGDSATFIVSADSVFEKTFHEALPSYIKKGSTLRFEVKLKDFKTMEAFEAEKKAKADKAMNDEQKKIDEYLKTNNIAVQPTSSGLYFIETTPGKGKPSAAGKTVTVNYTGKFMDGKVFDTSVGKPKPFEFPLGQHAVIAGWDEAISMMKEGGKATIIVPSKLAYGAEGAGGVIPPYTPLVFDVELISVK